MLIGAVNLDFGEKMSKFLQHSNGKEYHYIVQNNWAISPAYNGEFVVCERTDTNDGTYNQDGAKLDSSVGDTLRVKLDKSVKSAPQYTLKEYIELCNRSLIGVNNIINTHLPIENYPNVTKSLATGMSKIFEAAIFNLRSDCFEFMCFAPRKTFVNYLLLRTNLFAVNPEYLYYVLPENKDNFVSILHDKVIIVHNKDVSKMSILGTIDLERRLDFLTDL
jgi:hypothetical protein